MHRYHLIGSGADLSRTKERFGSYLSVGFKLAKRRRKKIKKGKIQALGRWKVINVDHKDE
jgi:hypothetical protein